jgi:hypothetical protein
VKPNVYVHSHFNAVVLGFGAGKVNQSIPFDISVSLLFWTFGFRVVRLPKVEDIYERSVE